MDSPSVMQHAKKAAPAVKKPYRSRLISEKARDLSRHSDSIASSTGSCHGTVSPDSTESSGFNPEKHDVNMSTRQFTDNSISRKLPNIRDTAKKCGRWAPRPQSTFVVDTSAIGRAFPDFTGGMSSDDDYSLEVGRGNQRKVTNSSYTNGTGIYIDKDSDPNSPIVHFGSHQILHTPKISNPVFKKKKSLDDLMVEVRSNRAKLEALKANEGTLNLTNTNKIYTVEKENAGPQEDMRSTTSDQFDVEQKENIPPLNNTFPNSNISDHGKTASPYTSNASRSINGRVRSLQAKVADENDATERSGFSVGEMSFNPSEGASNTSGYFHLKPQATRKPFNIDDYKEFLPAGSNKRQDSKTPTGNEKDSADSEKNLNGSEKDWTGSSGAPDNSLLLFHGPIPKLRKKKATSVSPPRSPQRAPLTGRPRANSENTIGSMAPSPALSRSRPLSALPSPISSRGRGQTIPAALPQFSPQGRSPTTFPSRGRPLSRVEANHKIPGRSESPERPLTGNRTQASFVAPGGLPASEVNMTTYEMGVPVSVQLGTVRKTTTEDKTNKKHGRVDGFDLPEEEEDIYAMCDRQKARIAQLEKQAIDREDEVRDLMIERDQYKLDKISLGLAMDLGDIHECTISDLKSKHLEIREAHDILELQHGHLKNDYSHLKEEYSRLHDNYITLKEDHSRLKHENDCFQSHQCEDSATMEENRRLEYQVEELSGAINTLNGMNRTLNLKATAMRQEIAQHEKDSESREADLEKAISDLTQEKETHKCRDKELEQRNVLLQKALDKYQRHVCKDPELATQYAQLQQQLSKWKDHQCKDARLEQQYAHAQQELNKWNVHKCHDHQLENQNAQLQEELNTLKSQQSKDNGIAQLKVEIARLKLEKKTWESSHRRVDSAIGDSSSERGSPIQSHYQQHFDGDVTLRPSMSPAAALAKLMSSLEDEIARLQDRLARYTQKYRKHDPKTGNKERKKLEEAIKSLVTEISEKGDQLYLMRDVEFGL